MFESEPLAVPMGELGGRADCEKSTSNLPLHDSVQAQSSEGARDLAGSRRLLTKRICLSVLKLTLKTQQPHAWPAPKQPKIY
jgi:hypothetical protein